MVGYDPTSLLGISIWWLLLITVWETIWTGLAMWRSAKNKHIVWFIIFLIVNILGIPEIIYLVVTRNKKKRKKK